MIADDGMRPVSFFVKAAVYLELALDVVNHRVCPGEIMRETCLCSGSYLGLIDCCIFIRTALQKSLGSGVYCDVTPE